MNRMTAADSQLVEGTLAGDLDCFGELHRRYFDRVVSVVSGIVGDRVRAEDTAQEAYTSALESLPRLDAPERFYPWLCRIAVNRAIEDGRRTTRRSRLRATWLQSPDEEGATLGSPPPAGALDGMLEEERAGTVRAALDQLPERSRAALVLRFFDGLPMKSIAEALDCTENNARTIVFRSLRKLGALIGETSP